MKVTEHEMRGLVAGKCVPADMLVNEELPAYLVRKFSALQQKLDAVLAENVALKAAIPNLKDVDYGNDNMDDVSLAEYIGFNDAVTLMNRWKGETPATDAILNEVRAEGAIAVRDALVMAEEGADLYAIATQTAAQLRTGSNEGGV